MTHEDAFAGVAWRKSSFSGGGGEGGGQCIELAPLPDGRIAVRHSTQPHGPIVLFTQAELDAWLTGCKAGEFDDLA